MSSNDPAVPVGARTMWGTRPLPKGLSVCDACGEIRGTTRDGLVSGCLCSGVVCNACGERRRRPITDCYDARRRSWWHVPWFTLMTHRCPGLDRMPTADRWTTLESDPAVEAYRAAVSAAAWAELDDRLRRREVAAAAGRVVHPGLHFFRGRPTTDEERGADLDIGASERDP